MFRKSSSRKKKENDQNPLNEIEAKQGKLQLGKTHLRGSCPGNLNLSALSARLNDRLNDSAPTGFFDLPRKSASARQSLMLNSDLEEIGIVPSESRAGIYFSVMTEGATIDDYRIGQLGYLTINRPRLMSFDSNGNNIPLQSEKIPIKILKKCTVKKQHLRYNQSIWMEIPGFLVQDMVTHKQYYVTPRMIGKMFNTFF